MKITKEQIMLSEVRMLTLNEPFASLVAFHGKQETRNRDTKVRGLVLIHAAKCNYKMHKVLSIAGKVQFNRIFEILPNWIKNRGKSLAIGYLVGTKCMGDHPSFIKEIEDKCFVQYHQDLWIWEFEDMTPIEPIPIKGKQGWKILNDEQKALINPL